MDTLDIKKRDGYNVKRLREILGIKQEDLAHEMHLTQQAISRLEAKDVIDDDVLERIASVFNVPTDAIRHFNENAAANIIANTFQDESVSYAVHYKCTFNPLDKVVELYDQKVELLERMLRSEQDKVAFLEKKIRDMN